MTPTQITLIQESFAAVAADADGAASAFYTKLFMADPSLRGLFRGNMKEQGRKLMGMIGMVVAGLKRLDSMIPAIEELGRRHVQYGVRDVHYLTVGEALIGTLAQALGERFTHDVQDAWASAYGVLASTMMSAAAQERAAA
jgi:hemoglobin-like flavoprotein